MLENTTNWFDSLRKFKKVNSTSKEYLGSNGSTEGKYASVGEVNNVSGSIPKVETRSLQSKILTEDEEDILKDILEDISKNYSEQSLVFLEEILKICLNDDILMSNIKNFNKFDIHNDTKNVNVFELMSDIENSLKKIIKSMKAQDISSTLIFSLLKNFDNKFYILSYNKLSHTESDYVTMNGGNIANLSDNYKDIDAINEVYKDLKNDTDIENKDFLTKKSDEELDRSVNQKFFSSDIKDRGISNLGVSNHPFNLKAY